MSVKKPKPEPDVQLDGEELVSLRQRLQSQRLEAGDFTLMLKILDLVVQLQALVKKRSAGLTKLLRMIFGLKTEKKKGAKRGIPGRNDSSGNPCPPKKGRNGRHDYPGAQKTCVQHGDFKEGDICPECQKGKLREAEPSVEYAWAGHAPITLTIFLLQRLVCDLCKKVFTAHVPEDIQSRTVDDSADDTKTGRCDTNASANAMVVLMRFQYGVPNYRLAGIQGNCGVPLPEGTQHQMATQVFAAGIYIFEALIEVAAQGDLFHNDDTRMRISDVLATSRKVSKKGNGGRVSTRTSVIISKSADGHEVVLYFTGSAIAGENLAWVLSHRSDGKPVPRLMCDGLNQNHPKGEEVVIANCLGHARRKFYDLNEKGHDLSYVLSIFGQVYVTDAQAKISKMDDSKRLKHHRTHSQPAMDDLKKWLEEQRDFEPNSDVGGAISYCLNHWEELTLFLRESGIPITNDIAEHMLKNPAVRHRKASLHYKTLDGALRGDVFMSLIATCERSGTNPFEYLTKIQEYRPDVIAHPELWLPWNYQERLNYLKEHPPPPLPLLKDAG